VNGIIAAALLAGCAAPPAEWPAGPGEPPLPAVAAPAVERTVAEHRVADVAVGDQHACAVLDDGTVHCWGAGSLGQRGADIGVSAIPRPVGPLEVAVDVEVAAGRTCVLLAGGGVACWGGNFYGEVDARRGGDRLPPDLVYAWCPRGEPKDAEPDNIRLAPSILPGIDDALDLAVGFRHTCVLRRGGRLTCWGQNRNGELGPGAPEGVFVRSDLDVEDDAVEVRAGWFQTCVLRANGKVRCWGRAWAWDPADDGLDPGPLRAMSVPGNETCGVRPDGSVACWGGSGLCGLDPPGPAPRPVAALHDAIAVEVSAGGCYSCALTAGGRVRCWPYAVTGALDEVDGADVLRRVVEVPGLRDVAQVVVGAFSGCARARSGQLHCWGRNETGLLGPLAEKGAMTAWPVRVPFPRQ
jgi:alpha-tubulin suppressor-like RCC1 family protein